MNSFLPFMFHVAVFSISLCNSLCRASILFGYNFIYPCNWCIWLLHCLITWSNSQNVLLFESKFGWCIYSAYCQHNYNMSLAKVVHSTSVNVLVHLVIRIDILFCVSVNLTGLSIKFCSYAATCVWKPRALFSFV